MSTDDKFTPRLGRIRAKGKGSFRGQIFKAIQRAGGFKARAGKAGPGTRSGQGRGLGSGRIAGTRRVVIKARFTQLAGKGLRAARAHLRYLQRDGTTREGNPGTLYDQATDRADGRAFLDQCREDRHLFRFIVSAEDGDQYDDLKSVTRRLMAQMEKDLGTRLEWVAVDHFNTGRPHTHIVVRGIDDQGRDLVISRAYLSQGMRERAEALVTLDLGLQSEQERNNSLRREIDQARLTRIDRQLLAGRDAENVVNAAHRDSVAQTLRAGRCQTLAAFGLAEELGNGRWRLDPAMETTLRDMGQRGDIIKSLSYDLQGQSIGVDLRHAVLHLTPETRAPGPVTGEVLRRGPLDDFGDRHFVALNATDGRVHVFDTGKGGDDAGWPDRAIVQVRPVEVALKPADHAILSVAGRNSDVYEIEAHLRLEPTATETFAQTHVRRLEAIRRAGGAIERTPDGAFHIGDRYAQTALTYEQVLATQRPVQIEQVSSVPIDRLPTHAGLTWLDRADLPVPETEAGFGGRVRQGLAVRTAWLAAEGLGVLVDGRRLLSRPEREGLRRREWEHVAGDVRGTLDKPYVATQRGERLDGKLTGYRDTAEGRLAVIERARDFTLVPWRPVLEPHIGKQVSGVVDGGPINWTIGRSRGRGLE
ncbi:DUF3363 domain-containing protein [Asticcacaulis sp. BYS171W]|uniref:DUF3363 domain-containing protein n=1 Tax=Asticcacaulis aquaticus TaxID=2984212 RepID=A0ABT5HQP3_9CAUL|nr:DUF3363 domain-containing protein [Asticcacaulis aquaticus]MDC7682145.1 DUF3363 domain-containing protein [Asticcacaulis aquaticus]